MTYSQEMLDNPAFYEMRTGEEHHTSNWAKFYVRGADALAVEARTNNRHENYIDSAGELPAGTLLTLWASDGDKRGTDTSDFWLLVTDPGAEPAKITGVYNTYFAGRYRILAHGDGKIRAPRLLAWWSAAPEHTERMARHLGEQILRRGVKDPAPLPDSPPPPCVTPSDRAPRAITVMPPLPCVTLGCANLATAVTLDPLPESTGQWIATPLCAACAQALTQRYETL